MAASANPSGVRSNGNSNGGGRQDHVNDSAAASNDLSVTENSGPTKTGLRHNPGLSLDWTTEEQSILEDLVKKYASEPPITRYCEIAQALNDKTARDVALRCRWMNKKENGKRRKDDPSRKNKDKKEKVTDSMPKSSQVANLSNGPLYAQPMMSIDSDDGISYQAIGGAAAQLLEQTDQVLEQISANFAASKSHENITLFCQAQTNIRSILNEYVDTQEIMKLMPPLPVPAELNELNEKLANTFLP